MGDTDAYIHRARLSTAAFLCSLPRSLSMYDVGYVPINCMKRLPYTALWTGADHRKKRIVYSFSLARLLPTLSSSNVSLSTSFYPPTMKLMNRRRRYYLCAVYLSFSFFLSFDPCLFFFFYLVRTSKGRETRNGWQYGREDGCTGLPKRTNKK